MTLPSDLVLQAAGPSVTQQVGAIILIVVVFIIAYFGSRRKAVPKAATGAPGQK